MKTAIIGTGISGLSAAWLLNQSHDITVFESGARIGGHSNTVDLPGHPPIDTGFIVFNDWTYPNFIKLLEHLGVASTLSDMSFAVSMQNRSYEYSSNALFPRFSNYLNPAHLWMLVDLVRFYKMVQGGSFDPKMTLNDFLKKKFFSKAFTERHILPMAAAIWSADPEGIKNFPMRSFAQFFVNHGLLILDVKKRPKWRTVSGGSRSYVEEIAKPFMDKIRLNSKITDVIRHRDFIEIVQQGGKTEQFEQVVLGVHSDQALALLARPSPEEQKILSAIPYKQNKAYLHQDRRLMPQNKKAWASWNFMQDDPDHEPYLTYWMNMLQPFISRGQDYFVTLNPPFQPDKVLYETNYAHPQFLKTAPQGWEGIKNIQGKNRTWYCGAWCGYGFHEDGLSSGLSVAEQLGGIKRPWDATEKSPAGENCRAV